VSLLLATIFDNLDHTLKILKVCCSFNTTFIKWETISTHGKSTRARGTSSCTKVIRGVVGLISGVSSGTPYRNKSLCSLLWDIEKFTLY